MKFKDRLRELRKEKNERQTDIANELVVSKMCISHWEKGNSEPSIEQLIQLAKHFDVTVDYLVGKTDD